MKTLIVFTIVLISIGCNAETKKTLPLTSAETALKKEQAKVNITGAEDEDCDDKAKKPVEIKPEGISLSGNTGCSLDEAH